MTAPDRRSLYVAGSLAAALDALSERGADGAPFAGGTWIMRAPLRHERQKAAYVALSKVAALKEIAVTGATVEIGAGATHAALAAALGGHPDLAVLAAAAGRSANPAIRAVATVGGNLCAADFPAADLVPALLCLDAEVEIAARSGTERMSLARFLAIRAGLEPGRLVTKVVVGRSAARSAHARLPLRKAGDYPVAVASLSVSVDAGGRVEAARVAIGSVETAARRWDGLEAALVGRPLDPEQAGAEAAARAGDFTGRDGVEAPGWYRVAVLPRLVRSAAAAILASA